MPTQQHSTQRHAAPASTQRLPTKHAAPRQIWVSPVFPPHFLYAEYLIDFAQGAGWQTRGALRHADGGGADGFGVDRHTGGLVFGCYAS